MLFTKYFDIDISKINAGYKFYKKKGIPDAKTNFTSRIVHL